MLYINCVIYYNLESSCVHVLFIKCYLNVTYGSFYSHSGVGCTLYIYLWHIVFRKPIIILYAASYCRQK